MAYAPAGYTDNHNSDEGFDVTDLDSDIEGYSSSDGYGLGESDDESQTTTIATTATTASTTAAAVRLGMIAETSVPTAAPSAVSDGKSARRLRTVSAATRGGGTVKKGDATLQQKQSNRSATKQRKLTRSSTASTSKRTSQNRSDQQ